MGCSSARREPDRRETPCSALARIGHQSRTEPVNYPRETSAVMLGRGDRASKIRSAGARVARALIAFVASACLLPATGFAQATVSAPAGVATPIVKPAATTAAIAKPP